MKPLFPLALASTLLGAGLLAGAGSLSKGEGVRGRVALRGRGVAGGPVVAPVPGARLTVVALTSTTCPLCLRYGPTLARLEDAYAAKGVRFVFVDPEPDATAAGGRAAVARLGLGGPYVLSPEWARALGARTTTETFVLDAAGRTLYRGAVDDQHAIGASLPRPRHRYLADALDAVLAGRRPRVAATPAPGCALALGPTAAAVPAYYGRVEGVVQKNCLPCHREGGAAPFRLDSYGATKARAPMIREVVERGIMPPWHAAKGAAAKGSGPWRNDRSLGDADRRALLDWAGGGTPKGDPKRAAAPPRFVPGWTIGRPDAVFAIPEALAVPAEGTMPYRNVEVATGFAEDRWVRRIEVLPSDRRVVHHVLVFVRKPGEGGSPREGLDGFFGGYVPGNSAMAYGDGVAKRLPKGAVLRFQIHYTPNGTATTDRTRIGLVFAPRPEHEVFTLGLSNPFFSIPPNAADHEVRAEVASPFDAEILSFLPHMHLRGKAARYELARADGTRRTLLEVPRYDFNWQTNYVAATPIPVRRGERVVYTAW